MKSILIATLPSQPQFEAQNEHRVFRGYSEAEAIHGLFTPQSTPTPAYYVAFDKMIANAYTSDDVVDVDGELHRIYRTHISWLYRALNS